MTEVNLAASSVPDQVFLDFQAACDAPIEHNPECGCIASGLEV